jgi:hypothetical protein
MFRLLNADDVHLIGIVSMYVASKYVDYYPLKMKIVTEAIGHSAFSVETIKAKERDILGTLRFDVTFATVLTFLDYLIEKFTHRHCAHMLNHHWAKLATIKNACIYLAKLTRFDYKLLGYKHVIASPC